MLSVLGGCATATPKAPRVAEFRVDEARRAFTLTIQEPGAPLLEIAGDAKGTPIPPAERRALIAYLDEHIERLEGVAGAEKDVKWMKEFRRVYGGDSGTGTGTGTERGR